MLTKSPSILFAEYHPWNSDVKVGGHHYAEQFAKDGWSVLWLANFININRIIRRNLYDQYYFNSWKSGVKPVCQNIYTYSPLPIAPYINFSLLATSYFGRHSLQWCIPSLKRMLTHSNFDPVDILWISQPRMASITNVVKYQRLVYRMFDNVQHFKGEPQSINQVEEWLCRKSDIVFATSHLLVTKAKKWNSNVVYLPNGADITIFQKPNLDMPEELKNIPSPRVLYIGAVADWFDFDIVYKAAKNMPQWSFIFIGPWADEINSQKDKFCTLPNIYVLGPKNPELIPAFARYADVGLIPFKINELTHSVSPIKLFEYCAAGLPVIAPHLHEIEQYKEQIIFYSNFDQFIENINTGIMTRHDRAKSLREFSFTNSWEARYHQVCSSINNISETKCAS